MATFLCPQGDRCGEVQLFFVVCDLFLHLGNLVDVTNELFLLPCFLSVLPMVLCAPNYANLYKSVQNDVFLGKNLIVGIIIIFFFFQLTPAPAQQKTDSKGQATFGQPTVSATK